MEKLPLKVPVTKGERTVTELKFQDAKVRHMMATDGFKDKAGYGADVALTSALTGEPEAIIGEIGPEDWPAVKAVLVKVYAGFMGISLDELKEAAGPPDQAEESGASEK